MKRLNCLPARLGLLALLLSCISCQWVQSPPFSDYVGPAAPSGKLLPATTPATQPASAIQRATAPAASQPTITGRPLTLSISQAIVMGLENNRAFAVQRYSPLIQQTFEDTQRAVFDPVLSGSYSYREQRSPGQPLITTGTTAGGAAFVRETETWNRTHSTAASIGLSEFFPTGTQVALNASIADSGPDGIGSTRTELRVTQSLLRGAGLDVNLASLRSAIISTQISQYQLRGVAEALVAQIEQGYWDYVLAQRNIAIVEESLRIAQQQLDETNERIKVGKLAETERAAGEAEVALRRQNLITARSDFEDVRLRLLRLLSPSGSDIWQRELILTNMPVIEKVHLEAVENYVNVALRLRPDLNQARLQVQQGDLEIIQTKNGLLPRLDLFTTLGKTGYAQTVCNSTSDLDGKGYDVLAGISGDYPIFNRAAIAADRSARLGRDQSVAAVENLAELVQTDVRTAYIEVLRYQEQIVATAATRRAQEETLRAETEKYKVGRSTSFLVSQASRDLLVSQLNEIQAMVSYLKALVDLHRLDGSLLERRGIAAPGSKPVSLAGQVGK